METSKGKMAIVLCCVLADLSSDDLYTVAQFVKKSKTAILNAKLNDIRFMVFWFWLLLKLANWFLQKLCHDVLKDKKIRGKRFEGIQNW